MLECLYDQYMHSGQVKFSYGQPFSYFSKPIISRTNKPPPPGFEFSDLNKNAIEFNPCKSPLRPLNI